jgi:uncharacterized low-complexity protein
MSSFELQQIQRFGRPVVRARKGAGDRLMALWDSAQVAVKPSAASAGKPTVTLPGPARRGRCGRAVIEAKRSSAKPSDCTQARSAADVAGGQAGQHGLRPEGLRPGLRTRRTGGDPGRSRVADEEHQRVRVQGQAIQLFVGARPRRWQVH